MKKSIYLLTILSIFNYSFGMEEKKSKYEETHALQNKEVPTLAELSARSIEYLIIATYDQADQNIEILREVLDVFLSPYDVPEVLITRIYSDIVKTFNRPEIIFYLLFNLYEKTEKMEDKVKLVTEFLGNFSREVKTLLANHFGQQIITIIESLATITIQNTFGNFQRFVEILTTCEDMAWLPKFHIAMYAYKDTTFVPSPRDILEKAFTSVLVKFQKYFEVLYIKEQKKAQTSNHPHIPDNLMNLAEKLLSVVNELDGEYDSEEDDIDEELVEAEQDTLQDVLAELTSEDRYKIILYILLYKPERRFDFDDLYDLLFPNSKDIINEGITIINMISEYYPETIKNIYVNFGDSFNINHIDFIKKGIFGAINCVCENIITPGGKSDKLAKKNKKILIDELLAYPTNLTDESRFDFAIYVFKRLFDQLISFLEYSGKELLDLRKLSSNIPAKLSKPLNQALDLVEELIAKKSTLVDTSKLTNLTKFKIYALFDSLIEQSGQS